MKAFKVKPDVIINDYKNFKEKYKVQWELFRNKIILDSTFNNFDTLKTLIEDFDIVGSKIVNNTVETSIYGLVHINLLLYLIEMWVIALDDIKNYYNQLLESRYFTNLEYHLDFYMLHAMLWKEVNFYLSKWVTEPMFAEEFSELKRAFKISWHFIVISLNYMLYKIGIESAIEIRSNIRELGNTELTILEEIRDIDPGKIGIDITFWKDWKTPKKMETTKVVKAEDLNQLYKIAQDTWKGKIKDIPIDNGKYFSWKVSKTTKFDK